MNLQQLLEKAFKTGKENGEGSEINFNDFLDMYDTDIAKYQNRKNDVDRLEMETKSLLKQIDELKEWIEGNS